MGHRLEVPTEPEVEIMGDAYFDFLRAPLRSYSGAEVVGHQEREQYPWAPCPNPSTAFWHLCVGQSRSELGQSTSPVTKGMRVMS